ncbi:hypothetical protein [Actinokineospora diospyrosa]|uniref:Uncharacterized protein n=1 Tax=Actinokineospora diospyrosa TaxID=103728 RepID=A0ABT1IJH5_9PSEU|nr:hypothetical protein [Actinokineospora diospyrosa]MCP2272803.1 hypothetical protein [Actinokineospora diospyrosa]
MSTTGSLTRRALLLATSAAAGLVGAAGLAACTPTAAAPPPPDPLAELEARALADAALARGLALVPDLAAKATVVAEARTEHARVLRAEMDRERPPKPSSSSSAATTTTQAAPTPPTDPPAAAQALLDGLTKARQEAVDVVARLPRYRAGLVGSVAAGCASLLEVLA